MKNLRQLEGYTAVCCPFS